MTFYEKNSDGRSPRAIRKNKRDCRRIHRRGFKLLSIYQWTLCTRISSSI